MKDIFKRNKIVLIAIIIVVIIGLFVFVWLFIYDSYRMPDTVPPEISETLNQGVLMLDIPDNALPPGVTRDQIVAEPILASELPAIVQGLGLSYAFRLEPDGLRFVSPVAFSVELPRYKGEVPLVYQIGTNGTLEVIEDTKITINEDGVAVLSGNLNHFSILGVLMRLDFEIKYKHLGAEALDKCRAAIEEMANRCEQYENWRFQVGLSRVDFSSEDGALRNDFVYEESEEGANQCPLLDAETNRVASSFEVESKSLITARSVQKTEGGSEYDLENYEIICKVSCIHWTCPAGDKDMSDSLPPTPTLTPVTPTPKSTPVPTPTPTPVPFAWALSYIHTAPGVYSEVFLNIHQAPPNTLVTAALTGSGVISPSTQTGTTDANGRLRLTWRINQFGAYRVAGSVGSNIFSDNITVQ